jgi:hypothetical protein
VSQVTFLEEQKNLENSCQSESHWPRRVAAISTANVRSEVSTYHFSLKYRSLFSEALLTKHEDKLQRERSWPVSRYWIKPCNASVRTAGCTADIQMQTVRPGGVAVFLFLLSQIHWVFRVVMSQCCNVMELAAFSTPALWFVQMRWEPS